MATTPHEPDPPAPIEWAWQGPLLEDAGAAVASGSHPEADHTSPPPVAAPIPPSIPRPLPVALELSEPSALEAVDARIGQEIAALRWLLSSRALAALLLLVGIGAAGYALVVRLAQAARDAGYDLDRRLVGIRGIAAVGAIVWVGGWIGRRLIDGLPLIGTALIALFLGGVILLMARQVVGAVGSMLAVIGARVREGDRLTVGDVTGIVEHAGLFRVRIRRPDGSTAHVPAQQLDKHTIVVSSPRRAQTVRVRSTRGAPFTAEEIERTTWMASLCPYRQAHSEVLVARPGDDERTVEVQIQVWSASAAIEAERWLRSAVAPPVEA